MLLKEIREKCKLTQKAAAQIAHTSLRTYANYEKDEINCDQLKLDRIKQMLEEYAQKNGFTNCVHFTDDGWSGATFHVQAIGRSQQEDV